MDRKEILNILKASRDWNNPSKDSKNWRKAFELFNEGKEKEDRLTDIGCSKCVETVKQWLTRD